MTSAPTSSSTQTMPPIDRARGSAGGSRPSGKTGGGGGGLITAVLAIVCVVLALFSMYAYSQQSKLKDEKAKLVDSNKKLEEEARSASTRVEALQKDLSTRYVAISTLPAQLQGATPADVRAKAQAMATQIADMTPRPLDMAGRPTTPGAPAGPGDSVGMAIENVSKAIITKSLDTKAAVGTDPAKVAIHRDVQLVLAKIGAYSKPVTGNQKDTQDAIMAFQKANGLKADGIIGKGTWGKVREKFEAQPRAAGN